MSGALYFPYISTPDDAWFTRVLLYWDTVGTLVPGGLEEDPKFISPQMAALREENLLQLVSPAFDLATVPNFRDAFAEYLEADEIVRSRRDNAELMRFTKVHVFKLGDVAEYLIDQKLARCRDGPGWERCSWRISPRPWARCRTGWTPSPIKPQRWPLSSASTPASASRSSVLESSVSGSSTSCCRDRPLLSTPLLSGDSRMTTATSSQLFAI